MSENNLGNIGALTADHDVTGFGLSYALALEVEVFDGGVDVVGADSCDAVFLTASGNLEGHCVGSLVVGNLGQRESGIDFVPAEECGIGVGGKLCVEIVGAGERSPE